MPPFNLFCIAFDTNYIHRFSIVSSPYISGNQLFLFSLFVVVVVGAVLSFISLLLSFYRNKNDADGDCLLLLLLLDPKSDRFVVFIIGDGSNVVPPPWNEKVWQHGRLSCNNAMNRTER